MKSNLAAGKRRPGWRSATVALVGVPALALAGGVPTRTGIEGQALEEIVVSARRIGLVGVSRAASEGIVLAVQIEARPVLRPGEVLETVPGLVVTQHSGDGKANQYYLRGFNLDHGTDFATRVNGIPVNMPTHGHGQGYADINFLIPELLEEVRYRKGTYYAEEGNFSAAGAADLVYRKSLDEPLLSLTAGEHDYYRGLLAASPDLGGGSLLLALDYSSYDGPWKLPQDFRKVSGIAGYSRGTAQRGWSLTGMGYHGRWDSTDQIPERAVKQGLVSRFGYIDPTDGGESHRYSVSADGWSIEGGRGWRANAYAIDYGLELVSNFTYAIDEKNGDQFEQYDQRRVYGGRFAYQWPLAIGTVQGTVQAGAELRLDDIDPVGLYLTESGRRYQTIREDVVQQGSYSAWLADERQWNDWLRIEAGVRYDYFDFEVDSDLALNSGSTSDSIFSPKLTLVFGPWAETEYFLNMGWGFHSNDARGTTIRVDPTDGVSPVDRVDPLVPAEGAEIGLRSAIVPGLQLSLALWNLDIDSELLFVGDGGTTEASRASRRTGLELGVFWTPLDWLIMDADFAWTRARFREADPAGDRIPGAVESVASLGITVDRSDGWFGGARLRHFGAAPLIEDDSVRSDPTTLVNLELGYRFTPALSGFVTVFNLFDAEDNDITYFYESRLPGEATPVEDIHFHPVEPRTLRATLNYRF
jgi:outer membrane receptor protein involved in Fe transport